MVAGIWPPVLIIEHGTKRSSVLFMEPINERLSDQRFTRHPSQFLNARAYVLDASTPINNSNNVTRSRDKRLKPLPLHCQLLSEVLGVHKGSLLGLEQDQHVTH
jgi:hypothetical protein